MQLAATGMDLKTVQESVQTSLLEQSSSQIPGSVRYTIRRYAKPANWMGDDAGILAYHYKPSDSANNRLELSFCLSGQVYCTEDASMCQHCRANAFNQCQRKENSIDFIHFEFTPTLLDQFVQTRSAHQLSEQILAFRHRSSFTRSLSLCGKTRMVLDALLNNRFDGSLGNIFVNAQTQMLLLYSLDCLDEKQIDVISCKFLANEADREKIVQAREVLLQHIGEPITIKELSRKVAMNECYLKKGFKEMFGTTIFDFYQSQRMEHAKYLLYEKGLNVTEVSMLLGYSSISHFSTAFKKHTGLKPCELLLR